MEFDGDAVDWSDVKEIETHKLAGYLLSGALDKQIDKLPVPWFPFRGLALNAASQVALTAIVATVDGVFRRAFDVAIPAEVHYRGLLRERTLTPGMLATVLLADPAVRGRSPRRRKRTVSRYARPTTTSSTPRVSAPAASRHCGSWCAQTATRSSAWTAGLRISAGRSEVERPSMVASSVAS